jgi:hypothetical protein
MATQPNPSTITTESVARWGFNSNSGNHRDHILQSYASQLNSGLGVLGFRPITRCLVQESSTGYSRGTEG